MKAYKRILSLVLCVLLCISLFPAAPVFAESETADTVSANETQEQPAETIPAEEKKVEGEGSGELLEEKAVVVAETQADTFGTCGDSLTWTLMGGTLTVSGTGEMENYTNYPDVPWYRKRNSIQAVVIESGVTSIGSYAFGFCTALTDVTIPESVTDIGNYAFYYCTALAGVTLPESVTSLGDQAFYFCTALTGITLPAGITHIGDAAFLECRNLLIEVSPDNESYCSIDGVLYSKDKKKLLAHPGGMNGAFAIPDGVTSLGILSFYGCTGLTSVTIPSSVTNIDMIAFSGCTGLTDVYYAGSAEEWSKIAIASGNDPLLNAELHYKAEPEPETSGSCGENLTWELSGDTLSISGTGEMENYLYAGTPWNSFSADIKTVVIDDGATSIGSFAFGDCTGLADITVPRSVTVIGEGAFSGCESLSAVYYSGYAAEWSSITIGSGNDPLLNAELHCEPDPEPDASGSCGANLIWALYGDTLIISGTGEMENYRVSTDVPWADQNGVDYRENIKTVIIENGVMNIGNYAFNSCSNLTDIAIPDSVTGIGERAFVSCSSLKDMTIPASVKSIGKNAFMSCTHLDNVVIPSGVTSIESFLFAYCTDLKSVTIPNSVTSISSYAFMRCGALSSIELPASVRSIESYAFSGTALSGVTIPESVTNIGNYVFYDCASLTSIILPVSVTEIGNSAFYKCSRLATVYYIGSVSEWNRIKIGSSNEPLKKAKIYFNWAPSEVTKEEFVDRLYEVCLGRGPSDEDRVGAVWQLENGTTGVQLARNFVLGEEFTAKNYCDRHYVIALYNAFMGREPEENEIESWMYRLQQGDRREDVFNEFAVSDEFGDICKAAGIVQGDKIEFSGTGTKPGGYCSVADCTASKSIVAFAKRLYNVCLDREPVQDEIDAWHYYLVHGEHTATSAAEFFLFGQEFTSRHYDDSEFVKHLYRAMMGREPDAEGLEYWVWLLENGTSREDAFNQFAQEDEFKKICQEFNVVHK